MKANCTIGRCTGRHWPVGVGQTKVRTGAACLPSERLVTAADSQFPFVNHAHTSQLAFIYVAFSLTDLCDLESHIRRGPKDKRQPNTGPLTVDIWQLIALASLFLAFAIAFHVWASEEPTLFKCALTILVAIPVIGPLAYVWISSWPSSSPRHLRSEFRGAQLDSELERIYSQRRRPRREWRTWNGKAFVLRQIGQRAGQSFIARLRHPSKPMFALILVLGAIFLARWWLLTLLFLNSGWVWGYPTIWGGSVGTFLFLPMLIVATPLYFWYAWKNWPVDD